MPRVEASRSFPISVKDAFDYITYLPNWRNFWQGYVGIDGGEENASWRNPGDELTLRLKNYGKDVEMRMHLDEFVPYERIRYRSEQKGLPDFRHERYFRDTNGTLTATNAVGWDPRGGAKGLVDRFVLPMLIKRKMVKTLADLDEIFGTGQPVSRPT
jgi:hypothetical protein